ncbi:MAG: hypothetical protein EBX53_11570 [Betaproteobacteria bacterium]|nr:hypothetical protein [Betaproteobacteria bacterium]
MQPKSNGAIRSNTKAMPVKMLDPDLEDVTDGVLESFDLSAFNPTFTSTRAVSIRPSSVSAAVTDFVKDMREYMTCMGIATKNGFSFEGSIQQFKAQDQTSNESASFTVFITLWDEASGQYKVVQGCDLGKSKEDQLLKILVEDSNRTPAEIERVVRSLQKRMLSLSHVSDATKDSYRKALSAAPMHGEEEPIDVQAEEKA